MSSMRVRNFAVLTLLVMIVSISTFACQCSNSTPIQKSYARYTEPDHAVFTARIVQLVGKIYNWDGKRRSSMALAVVHERHWGLPWYWPKIVLLDGSYPCDIAMAEGEEYLVAGRKVRYGVVAVNLCSRTQPLTTAQIDLRTLDGSHCSEPGGTLIGYVRGAWDYDQHAYRPMNAPGEITYVDYSGKIYRAKVGANGIYELQHLPVNLYTPKSRLDDRQYATGWGLHSVDKGVCQQRDITVKSYQVTGRLLPGIDRSVEVQMVNVKPGSKPIRADYIAGDGRFYFDKVEPGKYLLSVVSTIGDVNQRVFYPGVTNPQKAIPITVNDRVTDSSYDFDARVLPVVAIAVALDEVAESGRYTWDFQLLEGGRIVESTRVEGVKFGVVYGMRGGEYRMQLYGYPHDPFKDDYCQSLSAPVRVVEGMAPVHLLGKCASVDR